jgi:hypothetical protein
MARIVDMAAEQLGVTRMEAFGVIYGRCTGRQKKMLAPYRPVPMTRMDAYQALLGRVGHDQAVFTVACAQVLGSGTAPDGSRVVSDGDGGFDVDTLDGVAAVAG